MTLNQKNQSGSIILWVLLLIGGGSYFLLSSVSNLFHEEEHFSQEGDSFSKKSSVTSSYSIKASLNSEKNKMKNYNLNCLFHGEKRKIRVNSSYVRLLGKLCTPTSQLKSLQIFHRNHSFEVINFRLRERNTFSSDYISLARDENWMTFRLIPYKGKEILMDLLVVRDSSPL